MSYPAAGGAGFHLPSYPGYPPLDQPPHHQPPPPPHLQQSLPPHHGFSPAHLQYPNISNSQGKHSISLLNLVIFRLYFISLIKFSLNLFPSCRPILIDNQITLLSRSSSTRSLPKCCPLRNSRTQCSFRLLEIRLRPETQTSTYRGHIFYADSK